MIVLQGRGMLVAFDASETHAVRPGDEELAYIAIYKEYPAALQNEGGHRKMLEAQPQHHEHNGG